MVIEIDVIGQALRYKGNSKKLVSKTQEFIIFQFYFSEEWDKLTTFAQFTQNGKSYNVYLTNNQVKMPYEIEEGFCEMALEGTRGNVIAKTETLLLKISKNSINENHQSTEITLSLYSQLVDRLDNALSAVTSDSEVADIRMGVDGTAYLSAGTAVRTQLLNAQKNTSASVLYHLVNSINNLYGSNAIYNLSFLYKGYIDDKTGEEMPDTNWYCTDFIAIGDYKYKDFRRLKVSSNLINNDIYNAFYDEDKRFISNFSTKEGVIEVPTNAVYFRASENVSYGKVFIFKDWYTIDSYEKTLKRIEEIERIIKEKLL